MKGNKGIISLVIILIELTISGCGAKHHFLTDAEVAAADAGSYPNNYELLVKEWFTNNLKDPDSARYGCITKPKKWSYYIDYDTLKEDVAYGVLAEVNAKNSYGGYAGWTTYQFTLKNGHVIHALDGGSNGRLSCK